MINNTNNSIGFNGLARFSKYGQDTISVKTNKTQDKMIKLFADDLGKSGVYLSNVKQEKAIVFQKFIESIFNKKLEFGKSQKYISNMQNISKATNGEIKNYISYGTMITDKPGGVHFSLDLKA